MRRAGLPPAARPFAGRVAQSCVAARRIAPPIPAQPGRGARRSAAERKACPALVRRQRAGYTGGVPALLPKKLLKVEN